MAATGAKMKKCAGRDAGTYRNRVEAIRKVLA